MAVISHFISDPKVYDVSADRIFYRILLQDSIFQMFPYAEVILEDKTGSVFNSVGYTDQLDIDVGIEITDFDKLLHPFYIDSQKLSNVSISRHIAPTIEFYLLSRYKKQDKVQSKSYQGNLSDIILSEMSNNFNFDRVQCTTTLNNDYFYQPEIGFFDFIKNNIEDAYSTTYSKSPFLSFINLSNEFHFRACRDLIETNLDTIPTFTSIVDPKQVFDTKLIRGLYGGNLGLDFTKSNVEFKYLDDTMSLVSDTKKASDMLKGASNEKFLFKSEDTNLKRLDKNYGFRIDSAEDKDSFYNGFVNHQYLNTYFPLRLTITVNYPYLKQIVSGKNVKLDIESPDKNQIVSKLLSGQWLILDSKHIKGKKDIFQSTLLLGKNTTELESSNVFFNNYI